MKVLKAITNLSIHEVMVLAAGVVLVAGMVGGGVMASQHFFSDSAGLENQDTIALIEGVEHVPAKTEYVCEAKTAASLYDGQPRGTGTYCHHKRQDDK